jgi:hypothetical protein
VSGNGLFQGEIRMTKDFPGQEDHGVESLFLGGQATEQMSGSERVNNISGFAGLMSQDDNIGDRMSPLLGLNPWSDALLVRPFVSFVGFCLKLFLELPTDSPLTFVFFELFVVVIS